MIVYKYEHLFKSFQGFLVFKSSEIFSFVKEDKFKYSLKNIATFEPGSYKLRLIFKKLEAYLNVWDWKLFIF